MNTKFFSNKVKNAIILVAFFSFGQHLAVAQKANVPQKKKTATIGKKKQPDFLDSLNVYLKKQPAKIGVSMQFIPYNDSLAYAQNPNQGELNPIDYHFNGNDSFKMMSVAKLPIGIYAMMLVEAGKLKLDMPLYIDSSDLKRETYSPTVEGKTAPFTITLKEALESSLGLSDNITTDKIIAAVGGVANIDDFLRSMDFPGIRVRTAYKDMTINNLWKNSTTPHDMNRLLFQFYYGLITNPESSKFIYGILKNTPTGPKRLRGLLPVTTEVAHKTGTYYNDEVIHAINDVGFIKTPLGLLIISIFVNDSKLTPEATELVMATTVDRICKGIDQLNQKNAKIRK